MSFLRRFLHPMLVAAFVFGFAFSVAHAADYSHLDPGKVVPSRALSQAVAYLKKYGSNFDNDGYLVVIDYSQHSSRKRFYLINLNSGKVERHAVAHGSGSDTDNDGYATRFSNAEGSKATSLGFYRTLGTYSGKWGYSLRLQGLSSTNSNAYERAIVIHGASYVSDSGHAGRSWGCPALDLDISASVITRIKGGALVYAWSGQ